MATRESAAWDYSKDCPARLMVGSHTLERELNATLSRIDCAALCSVEKIEGTHHLRVECRKYGKIVFIKEVNEAERGMPLNALIDHIIAGLAGFLPHERDRAKACAQQDAPPLFRILDANGKEHPFYSGEYDFPTKGQTVIEVRDGDKLVAVFLRPAAILF